MVVGFAVRSYDVTTRLEVNFMKNSLRAASLGKMNS